MPEETKHGMECSQFDALLSEAVDGQLTGARKQSFEAHARVCAVCGPLIADALAGQKWMKSLAEVEPPVHLLHNILASTSGISSARLRATTPERGTSSLGERVRQWWDSFVTPTAAFIRQPRFVMSFGMIFFSFSLLLSAAGVKASDVANISLRPSAIKRTYYTAEGRIVKFYTNIRFVYEIESRVREFRKATTPAEPAPEKPNPKRKTNDTSGQPDQKQERNYSQETGQPVLAGLSTGTPSAPVLRDAVVKLPPDVTVTTNRRFV